MDNNFRSYADEKGLRLFGLDLRPDNPLDWDDTLKFSHSSDVVAIGGVIVGGRENAVDMNRECSQITLRAMTLIGGRTAGVVVKGGCYGIALRDILFVPDPKSPVDIEWDGWSAQSRKASTGVLAGLYHKDGLSPVRVAFGRFKCPVIAGGNVKILWLRTIGMHLYNIGKDLAVWLKLVPRV